MPPVPRPAQRTEKDRVTKKKAQSEYKLTKQQILLGIHLDELALRFQREFKFCERDWRFDILLPDYRIAIEIHGGQFSGGHRRGWWSKKEALRRAAKGSTTTPQEDEYDKLNRATMEGYRVLQFTNGQVDSGRAKQAIAEYLG